MMICCDLCDGWYHAECVGISVARADAMQGYTCKACGGNMDQEIIDDEYDDSDDDIVSPLPIDPRLMDMSSTCMFGVAGLGVTKYSYS